MKNTLLKSCFLAICFHALACFSQSGGSYSGFNVFQASPFIGNNFMTATNGQNALTYLGIPSNIASNLLTANGSAWTNLSGLVFTNSPPGYLTPGLPATVPALGFVSAAIVVTNTQIVWLSNQTSHVCFQMGNIISTWTNYDNATLFCNSGDSVVLTNIAGTGGATLVGSWFQALH